MASKLAEGRRGSSASLNSRTRSRDGSAAVLARLVVSAAQRQSLWHVREDTGILADLIRGVSLLAILT